MLDNRVLAHLQDSDCPGPRESEIFKFGYHQMPERNVKLLATLMYRTDTLSNLRKSQKLGLVLTMEIA